MKLTTKADKNSVCPNLDDQIAKDDEMHVRPAIGNTLVVRSASDTPKLDFMNFQAHIV